MIDAPTAPVQAWDTRNNMEPELPIAVDLAAPSEAEPAASAVGDIRPPTAAVVGVNIYNPVIAEASFPTPAVIVTSADVMPLSDTAYKATIKGPGRCTPALNQALNACKPSLYVVHFAYKIVCRGLCVVTLLVQNGPGDSDLRVVLLSGEVPLFITNGSWATFNDYMYVAASTEPVGFGACSTSIQVGYRDDAGPASRLDVFIDNVSVIPVSIKYLTVPATSRELVPNGGFESGELAPWETHNRYKSVVQQPGIGSNYGLHYSVNTEEGLKDY